MDYQATIDQLKITREAIEKARDQALELSASAGQIRYDYLNEQAQALTTAIEALEQVQASGVRLA